MITSYDRLPKEQQRELRQIAPQRRPPGDKVDARPPRRIYYAIFDRMRHIPLTKRDWLSVVSLHWSLVPVIAIAPSRLILKDALDERYGDRARAWQPIIRRELRKRHWDKLPWDRLKALRAEKEQDQGEDWSVLLFDFEDQSDDNE